MGTTLHHDIRAVERVRKRATKLIPVLRNLPYRERLKKLNLPLLEHRRKQGDMIIWKSQHRFE